MVRKSIAFADKSNFSSMLFKHKNFIACVYLLLAFQLAVTAGVISYLRSKQIHPRKVFFIPLAILSFLLILALAMIPMPTSVKLLLFTAFSMIIGLLSSAAYVGSPDDIKAAVVSTASMFVAMTAVAFLLAYAGIDLSFMGFSLLAALIGLLVSGIAVMFLMPYSTKARKVFLTIAVVIFSVFVAYDTNVMIMDPKDVTSSAIGLYLDVMNLFTDFLGLRQ